MLLAYSSPFPFGVGIIIACMGQAIGVGATATVAADVLANLMIGMTKDVIVVPNTGILKVVMAVLVIGGGGGGAAAVDTTTTTELEEEVDVLEVVGIETTKLKPHGGVIPVGNDVGIVIVAVGVQTDVVEVTVLEVTVLDMAVLDNAL